MQLQRFDISAAQIAFQTRQCIFIWENKMFTHLLQFSNKKYSKCGPIFIS